MQQATTYLPASTVCARYGVTSMTLWRWMRDEALSFPAPTVINKRRYWLKADLETWEASRTNATSHEMATSHSRKARVGDPGLEIGLAKNGTPTDTKHRAINQSLIAAIDTGHSSHISVRHAYNELASTCPQAVTA